MSATGRGRERAPRDYYPTPSWCTRRLLDRVGGRLLRVGANDNGRRRRWLEPCVGSAAIVNATEFWLEERRRSPVDWTLADLRPMTARPAVRGDYLKLVLPRVDVAITNPPFLLTIAFIEKMQRDARVACVLQRINFLGSIERHAFWKANPADVYVLPNRPKFGLNKRGKVASDATEYAWFVFGLTAGGHIEVLDLTPDAEIERDARSLRHAA